MRVTLAVFFAVVIAFFAGAVGGYAARGLTSAPVAAASAHDPSACPAGTHAVIWYSAHAWSCVSN